MRINNIYLNPNDDERILIEKASKIAKIKSSRVKYFKIIKKSLDARDKSKIRFIYNVEISDIEENESFDFVKKEALKKTKNPIVVVGAGPAGLFCALYLARLNLKPILIERGLDVDNREKIVDKFFNSGELNLECNIQYGEGGAGTFSDGKLNTSVNSIYHSYILKTFVEHGAPAEIEYISNPHIGSDNLKNVVKNIRNEIISLGGKVLFDTKLINVIKNNNNVSGILIKSKDENRTINLSALVLAIGHSARDTYLMLQNNDFVMETKDLAVGFRIEHKQENINKAQYGKEYNNKKLPIAAYKLTSHAGERPCFTFCMCPGGYVVAASSEKDTVVTNGMSNYKRDNVNANSAIVCQIKTSDFDNDVNKGIEYIRNFEKKAFLWGGGDYKAPCQLLGDFINKKESIAFGDIKPTYPLGTKFAPLHKFFPEVIYESLKASIIDMNKRLKGFYDYDAVLTAVESRTSAPVRIKRNEKYLAINLNNVYPCGELGYAGGIMSAAIDGIKIAKEICNRVRMGEII